MYQLTNDGVLNLDTGASIPAALDNRDWNEYLQWLAKGNSPLPACDDCLGEAKERAIEKLNSWRENVHAPYYVNSSRFLETSRWKTDPTSAYGLAREAVAREISDNEQADMVLNQWAMWLQASDKTESTYINYRTAILKAANKEEVTRLIEEVWKIKTL